MLNQVIFVGRIVNSYTNTEEPIVDIQTSNIDQEFVTASVVMKEHMYTNLLSIYDGDAEKLKGTFVGIKGTLMNLDDELVIRCKSLTVLNANKFEEPTKGGDEDDSE